MGNLTKPKVRTKQPKSQATPLSEDILGMLRGMMSQGGFGDPISSTQKAAAGGTQDFIDARKDTDAFNELMGPLRKAFEVDTDRAAAGQRESLGMLGGRFSTGLAREEGRLRGERATELDAMISQMFLQEQSNLLGALGLQSQQGQSFMQPFMDFGKMGIFEENMFIEDSPWDRYAGASKDVLDFAKGLKNLFKGGGEGF